MKNSLTKRITLLILWAAVLVFSSVSSAQKPSSGIHVLYDGYKMPYGQLRVWLLDELTGAMTPVVNIQQEKEQNIPDFTVDIEHYYLYFISVEGYPYNSLGEARLIRHNWETGAEDVVYARRNLTAIADYIQKDKLIVSYYPEDTQSLQASTPLYSCLLDLGTQTCREFGDVTKWVVPYDWIWLDAFRALRVNPPSLYSGNVELVDIETGAVRPIVAFEDTYFNFGQAIPGSNDVFLLGESKSRNTNGIIKYDLYRLNSQTFEMTFLTSISVPKPMGLTILSPDGKYLLFLQRDKWHGPQASDSVQVVDIQTGTPVFSYPLIIIDPSGEQLVLDDFQWGSDSTSILGIASAEESQTEYVVRLNIDTNNIIFLTTVEKHVGFVEPRYLR